MLTYLILNLSKTKEMAVGFIPAFSSSPPGQPLEASTKKCEQLIHHIIHKTEDIKA